METELSKIDARPVIPVNENSIWKSAETQRDAFAEIVEAELNEMGLEALVSKSQPGQYPVLLSMSAWKPEVGGDDVTRTKRNSLVISIDVNPYLTHPLLYDIKVKTDRADSNKQVWAMTEDDVRNLVRYSLECRKKPKILKGSLPNTLLAMTGIGAIFIDRNKLIKSARPNVFTGPKVLGFIAAFLLLISGIAGSEELLLLMPIGVLLAFVAVVWSLRRPKRYSLVNRPETAPRLLFLVDSWHTSVPDVGVDFKAFEDRMERAVSLVDPSIRSSREKHQYETPEGLVERDRLTFTKGQAVVHVYIYPFATDAFVGWDGFMNWARWLETIPVSTTIKNGHKIENRSLTTGYHIPTAFDLVEFNALTELVHRRIVMELKAYLKEREIEADLDFSIIRGDRSRALTEGKSAEETSALRKSSKMKFGK